MSNHSYSRDNLYNQCPRAFECRYTKKLLEAVSEALERGTAVHEAIAAYTRHCLDKGLKTDVQFLLDYQGTDEVREILETYADTHILEPGNYVIEEMWNIALGGHTWWGVIDQLKDEGECLIITDLKTDHVIRSQAEIDKDFQLRCYAWMAAQKYPDAKVFICRIDFVRYGVIREVTYLLEDIPAIEKDILAGIERIEADQEYKPTPGSYCGWCSWTADCPALTNGGLEVLTGPEDALALAGERIALDARRKAIDTLLKPWCTQEGAIEVNGMETGYFRSESVKYPDLLDLQVVLADSGRELNHFVRADTTAIKKAARADQNLAGALADIAVDNSKTTFKARKVKTS